MSCGFPGTVLGSALVHSMKYKKKTSFPMPMHNAAFCIAIQWLGIWIILSPSLISDFKVMGNVVIVPTLWWVFSVWFDFSHTPVYILSVYFLRSDHRNGTLDERHEPFNSSLYLLPDCLPKSLHPFHSPWKYIGHIVILTSTANSKRTISSLSF